MKIKTFTFNPFQENTYLLTNDEKECIIIDPGCLTDNEELKLSEYITENKLKIKKVLVTHLHLDHSFGLNFLQKNFNASVAACQKDEFLLKDIKKQAIPFGIPTEYVKDAKINEYIKENDIIKFGDDQLIAYEVPGHSPGSLMFYSNKSKCAFVGDVLFRGSIGRTDLAGGDFNTLLLSLQKKIITLPLDTTIYCGHGPSTTIKNEIEINPYI